MKPHIVRLQWLANRHGVQAPRYHSELAAGMDVQAALQEPVEIVPGAIVIIPTGFALAIEPGYEIQVRPRSGLAIKHGVTIVNAPGTIDADYRGEVKIGLVNLGPHPYTIEPGDRIAQLVLAPVCRAQIMETDDLPATARGTGGFGHSGR